MNFNLHDHTILLTVSGSRSYGIHTQMSDVDVKGVCIPPREYFLGCQHHFAQADQPQHIQVFERYLNQEQKEAVSREKLEGSIYHLHKFINLAINANPNILDVLFCREEEVLVQTKLGRMLREHRELFLSAKVKHTFSGYAFAQLKRIKGHRKWLLSPPTKKPERADFGLDQELIEYRELMIVQEAIQKKLNSWEWDFCALDQSDILQIKEGIAEILAEMQILSDQKWVLAARGLGASEELIAHIAKERDFIAAKKEWKQYQSWKKNRNPKRAVLEEKYHYDLKHAAHLVRLLSMGKEILLTGEVNVWREGIDADQLLDIRRGVWSYEQLIEWAEEQNSELDRIYKKKEYVLPHTPKTQKINALVLQMTMESVCPTT